MACELVENRRPTASGRERSQCGRTNRPNDRVVQIGPADNLVGEPRILAVVAKWRAVDAGGSKAGRQGDTDGGGGIPFVLTAEMHVRLRIAAYHRHRLRTGRAHV